MSQQKNASLKNQMAQANKQTTATVAPTQDFESLLLARKDKLSEILPSTMDVNRFMRVVISQRNTNPALRACDALSVMSACALAAQMGLEPGPLGHAYLVPFKDKGVPKAQFIIGYKGYIELARRSGKITSINVGKVCVNDDFEFFDIDEKTLLPSLRHKRKMDGPRGEGVAYYAVTHYNDGGREVMVLTRSEVEEFRKRSKVPNSPAWRDDYDAMALKTVCRRAATFWPLTIEASTAIAADNAVTSNLVANMAEEAAQNNYIDAESSVVDLESEEVDQPQGASGEELEMVRDAREAKGINGNAWAKLKHNTLSNAPENDEHLTSQQVSALLDAIDGLES